MTVGEAMALLANELDDQSLSHHTPAVATRVLHRAQTYVALRHGLLRRTLLLPVVANKALYHLPPLVPTLVEEWAAGQWANGTTTYTDDTTDAQDADANDFAISSLTNNDGHLVGARSRFSEVAYTLGTAHAGGAPVYEYIYWNGTAWTALTLTATPNFGTTGLQTLGFQLPTDWVRQRPTGVTFPATFDGDRYWIRVRATTAPTTTAASATIVRVSYTGTPDDAPARALLVRQVSLGGVTLWPESFEILRFSDGQWLSTSGPPTHWYPLGITGLGLFPVPSVDGTAAIEGVIPPPRLREGGDALSIPDAWVPEVIQLACGLLLLGGERAFQASLGRFKGVFSLPKS